MNKIKIKILLVTTMATALFSLPLVAPSQAQTPATQKIEQVTQKPVTATTSVDVKVNGYVFGFRVMKAYLSGTLTDDNYTVRADLYTSGFGSLLKKFQI